MTPEEFTHYTGVAIDQEHLWSVLEGSDKVPAYDTSDLSKEQWCKRWKHYELINYTSQLLNEHYKHCSQINSLIRQKEEAERLAKRACADRDGYKDLYNKLTRQIAEIKSICEF